MTYTLHHGDCLDVLHTLPDASVDAVITDPPYAQTNEAYDSAIAWCCVKIRHVLWIQ